MKILAIETSCDDTGIAVLSAKGSALNALANVVSSQPIHQNYGGVFPMMAKREHQRNLVPVLTQALQQANLISHYSAEIPDEKRKVIEKLLEKEQDLLPLVIQFLQTHDKPAVDYIAVTYGPGLEPCLWVGVNIARALSYFWDIPLIPINHIEAHILVNFLQNPEISLPAISLVVSGGHTQLVLVKEIGQYEIIGETRDDAAGECFDKCAKLLGLGYPGGPIVSKIAAETRKSDILLPRPMMNSKDYDFSFSGLKTAVLYETQNKELTKEYVGSMTVSIQDAICDVLIKKTLQAVKDFKAKSIMLGGGVSANQQLKQQFIEKSPVPVIFPEPKLSTDNGLMIAVAAYFNQEKTASWETLKADANLRIGA